MAVRSTPSRVSTPAPPQTAQRSRSSTTAAAFMGPRPQRSPCVDDGAGGGPCPSAPSVTARAARSRTSRPTRRAAALRKKTSPRGFDLARLLEARRGRRRRVGRRRDDDEDDEATVVEAAAAAEARLRAPRTAKADAIDRLAAAAAAARPAASDERPGGLGRVTRRARRPAAAKERAGSSRSTSARRGIRADGGGISAAEERWTPEPRPPPEPARHAGCPRRGLRLCGGPCGNQAIMVPRHRRHAVPVIASAQWRTQNNVFIFTRAGRGGRRRKAGRKLVQVPSSGMPPCTGRGRPTSPSTAVATREVSHRLAHQFHAVWIQPTANNEEGLV